MSAIYVKSIGLAAPGLQGWQASLEVLRGERPWQSEEMPKYAPAVLPANERRRATRVARLAFQAAEDAVGAADAETLKNIAAVFASSGGDTEVLNGICGTLALPDRPVSPTHFHNSVHNAAAGYWSIATGSRLPSTALSAHDGSFVAGMMEAFSMAMTEQLTVLLVTYDLVPPQPLHAKRPLSDSFASALLLSADADGALARLELRLLNGAAGEPAVMSDPGLETLRLGNPAARSLPLLAGIARQQASTIIIPGLQGERVLLDMTPC